MTVQASRKTGFRIPSLPWDFLISLGAVALFGLVIAKQAVMSTALFYAFFFFAGLVFFVRGRLPKAASFLYLLAAFLPFSIQLSADVGLSPDPLWVGFGLLACAWLVQIFSKEASVTAPAKSALDFPLFIFLSIGIVSVFHSVLLESVPWEVCFREFSLRWILPALIYKTVQSAVCTKPAFQKMVWILIAASTMAALIVVYDAINNGDVSDLENARIGGVANDPNVMAAFLNFTIFIPIALFLNHWKKPKYWLLIIPVLIMVRALLATYSRGGYVALALGLFVTLLFFKKRMLIPFLVAGIFVVIHPDILPDSMRERIGQTFEKPAQSVDSAYSVLDKSNRDRVEIWKGGLRMVQDHPVWGVGYTRFRSVIMNYWPGGVPFDAHNTFILIAAEMGVPALLTYLIVLGIMIQSTAAILRLSVDPFARSIALGMLGSVSTLLFNYFIVIRMDGLESTGYLWILAGLIMRLRYLESLDKGKEIPWFRYEAPN